MKTHEEIKSSSKKKCEVKPQPDISSSAIQWISNNQKTGIILASLLIILYMLPIVLVSICAWLTCGFMESNLWLSLFSSFLNSSNSTLADFHKVLFPVIAGISVVSLKDKPSKKVILFAVSIILLYVYTKWFHIYLNIKETKDALMGLPNPLDAKEMDILFGQIENTLITYFMMLIGIQVSNKIGGN